MGCYFTASIVIFLALSTCSSDHINLPQNDIKVQTNHTNVHFNSTTSTIPPTPAESAVHNSSSELISVPTKSPDGTKPPSPTTAPKTSHVVQPSAPAGAFVTALDANDAFSSFVYIIVCLTIVIMSYMVVKNFRWVRLIISILILISF